LKKRIYNGFLCVILLCALLLAVSVSTVVYRVTKQQEINAIQDRAALAADLLNRGIGTADIVFTDYTSVEANTARLTVIAPDGTVLMDNKAHAAAMENHAGRAEFMQAMQTGRGEATRYSSTIRADYYYYAIRLDGGDVLRVSMAMSSIVRTSGAVIPALFFITVLVLVAANFLARRLTRRILQPLEWIDLKGIGENAAVYDELIPYIQMIDRQKREIQSQLTALKNRADTIEVITGSMKEGLILLDRAGTVLIANASASDIFNAYSMAYTNILHICRDTEFQRCVRQCLSGVSTELTFDRAAQIYSVYFNPVFSGEAINGGVILFMEITERYEAEKQRREFSANVSHELKTPLTSISGLAELIENGMAKPEDIQGFAGKITAQTRRLGRIIEDIIRLSEFDEGNVKRESTEFDLYELTDYVVSVLREKANDNCVPIGITGERLRITANKHMMDELLYNLIDNAIKYNKENGSVTVALSREDGFTKIAVSDTGIGIPKEHQSRIFERFYRIDASRNKKTGGTGLGLSIVKHIAAHHGGRVEIESVPGKGTTVTCWLAV
jgi:two-component system phosphate regulon sensor histidine kinase PhoR